MYRQQLEKSTQKIEENLGYLERAAKATTGFFKEMWDAILGIGRADTLEVQIKKVEERLATLRKAQGMGFNRVGGADTAAAEAELANLRETKRLRDAAAAAEKARAAENKKGQRTSDIAFKDRGELPSARAQAETDLALANLKKSDAEFQIRYDQALTDLETYYRDRREVIEFSNREEARLAKKQLAQAQANLGKASLEERAGAQAAVVAAQNRVDVGGVQGEQRLIQFDADREKARRDLTRALNEYALKVKELEGLDLSAEAATLRKAQAEERYRNVLAQTKDPTAQRNIKAVRDNEVAVAELKGRQAELDRAMLPYAERRAEIQKQITEGAITQETGASQLFELEKRRNKEMLAALYQMYSIYDISLDQRLQIKKTIEATTRAANGEGEGAVKLRLQQETLERKLLPMIQQRADIEQDIAEGRISQEAGELRLFNLEKERNREMLIALEAMQAISNLPVEQRDNLDAAIAAARRGANALGGGPELRVQQAAMERQLTELASTRLVIEQQIRNGQISEIDGQEKLYALERQRNQLMVEQLTAMQQIPGLTVDQQNALKVAIDNARIGLQEITPLAREFNTTLRSGLEGAFADALVNVRSLKDGLRAVGQQIAMLFAKRAAAQAASGLFSLFGFAEGGHVRGPGTETSDSIPALLSNNEFVMPANAVRNYGVGFMEAIRKMQVPRGSASAPSTVPRTARYAEGGLVSSAAVSAGNPNQAFPVQVVVNNEGTAKNATAQTDFDGKSLVVSVLLNDIKNNGPVFRSMSSAQKSRR